MKNEIYASTGAFIGRANAYDHNLIKANAGNIHCDGFELMLYSAWYEDFERIIGEIADFGLNFPVVHFDKEIGVLNFYRLDTLRLVDLPGYGYAKVSQSEKKRWSDFLSTCGRQKESVRKKLFFIFGAAETQIFL